MLFCSSCKEEPTRIHIGLRTESDDIKVRRGLCEEEAAEWYRSHCSCQDHSGFDGWLPGLRDVGELASYDLHFWRSRYTTGRIGQH